MVEYEVIIPEESFAILEWEDEGLPAVCVVNQSLANFEPKIVFSWHLSIIVAAVELADNGMPTVPERQILKEIGDEIDARLKDDGNALFLARITWNGTCQLLYRIYDPEKANGYLQETIEHQTQKREFDFRMEADESWQLAEYYLSRWRK